MASHISQATFPRAKRVLKKAFTLYKLNNLFKNQLSRKISDFNMESVVWGLPPALMVETASVCNLRCPFCACGAGEVRREEPFLDEGLFKHLVDDLHQHLWMILFWNQGEPFLNPRFFDMIRYASDRKIYTLTSTNGHFLADYDAIIDSGLDELIISLDGATEEVYKKYRIGGDFYKVIRDTEKLMNRRSDRNLKGPYVTLQCVISRDNEHQIEALEKLARHLGVDELIFKTMEITPGADSRKYLPENPKYRRYSENPETWFRKNDHKNCPELWNQPVLNSDGSISVCCFDKTAVFKPGIYKPGNFRELWHGTEWMKIRETVKNKKAHIMPCKKCTALLNLNYRSILFK
ncbi:MAG: radical SAM/SPASM domain-containing protein [Fidelibacterota bacterium]